MAKTQTKTKRARKTPACPECGSADIVPIIHGVPTPAQNKALKKGKAVLANREEWEGMAEWYCKACGCDWSGEWRRFKRSDGLP
ncbi:MAG: hypothetical protein ACREQ7_06740 [Candidatus Binatia bacterium]